jgi:hypothetical protein
LFPLWRFTETLSQISAVAIRARTEAGCSLLPIRRFPRGTVARQQEATGSNPHSVRKGLAIDESPHPTWQP